MDSISDTPSHHDSRARPRRPRPAGKRVLKHTSAKARWASALGYGGREGEGPSCRHAYPGFSIPVTLFPADLYHHT
eukprot:scaffold2200_cov145-Isochrysis_galbana.AAC.2